MNLELKKDRKSIGKGLPYFSIVIPVYNVEVYLEKCVSSILSQRYEDFELILVDDGSTDRSSLICDELQKADKRIKVIHKKNGGSNSARNAGIFSATGEYICLVDSDDAVASDWLETIYKTILASPTAPDLIAYNFRWVYSDREVDNRILYQPGFYNRPRLEKEVFPRAITSTRNENKHSIWIPPWTKVYRNQLLREHCSQSKEIKVNNDITFTLECLYCSNAVYICPDVLYYYSAQSESSLQRTYHPDLFRNHLLLFQYLNSHLAGLHPTIPVQLNVLYASNLGQIIDQEFGNYQGFIKTRDRFKTELEETGLLDYISPRGLPFREKVRLILLKKKMYGIFVVLQKLLFMSQSKSFR